MGHSSDSAPRIDEISENFISKLAKEIVDDAILDAVTEHSEKLNECEESDEQSSCSSAVQSKKEVPLDVKILNFFSKIFTFKNMAKYLVFLLALMLADTLWDVIADMYSRPTILKPKGPRPFFSNSSSGYLTDFYTGEFRPERVIQNTDLLVVMYYSPWCFYSQRLRHPFEVVALMLRNHKNIRFVAVNCWTTLGECRKAYKIYLYPVIVAYSSTVHSMYQGEHSTDHLYRWIVNVRNPVQHVTSMEQLKLFKQDYHTIVIGYFPFKDMNTPPGYRAFAAAGMMLRTGQSEDESTCLAVVTNVNVARELGIRFEGDMVMYIPRGFVFQWSIATSRSAENIVEWVRGKRAEVAPLRWIHFNRNTELASSQFSQLLNESSVLLLITPVARIYRSQPDIVLLTELAREYWNCEQDNIQLVKSEPGFITRSPSFDELSNDKQACNEVFEGIAKMDSCCRSLLPSVDWNIACASSAKYHWEDEENSEERLTSEQTGKSSKRRSHWTEQVLTATNQCVAVRNGTLEANVVISRCCENYEEFSQLELTSVHKANTMLKLRARELMLVDSCMRSRLHDYMKYPLLNETLDMLDEPFPSGNLSLQGMACRGGHQNNTLKFAVLDSLHYPYFVNKWGLSKLKLPLVIAVDIKRDLFSVMEGKISQKRVREFISDFHSDLQADYLKSEDDNISSVTNKTQLSVHPRVRNEQVLQRLSLRTFHDVIESRHNTTSDVVVFFSGGSWHAPSTAAMHVYHSVASYFSSSNDLIKFYVVDTTRNELPYNFNFDRIPAIVIFLANQTDISWKYPEVLPISHPNVLSFVLSHCSARLRWKMALSNCGRLCVTHNRLRLRKRQEKLLNVIHRIRESTHQQHLETKLQYFVKQLRVVRRVLRALHIALHQSEVLAEESVNSLLRTKVFEEYIRE